MRSKDKTLLADIEKFVSNYTDRFGISPTMQEVAGRRLFEGYGAALHSADVRGWYPQLFWLSDDDQREEQVTCRPSSRSRTDCLRHSEIRGGKHRGIR